MYSNRYIWYNCNILFILLYPQFHFVSQNAKSTGVGLLIASLPLFCSSVYKIISDNLIINKKILLFFFVITVLIVSSSLYSFYTNGYVKPIYSLSILLIIFSSYSIFKFFEEENFDSILKTTRTIFIILIIIAAINVLFDFKYLNYENKIKGFFPFSEHSHFALAIGPFFIIQLVFSKLLFSIFSLFILLALSLYLPNFTLLVFTLIGLIITLYRYKKFLVLIFPLVIIIFLQTNLEYFKLRLDFNASENLTQLVYIQGWELIFKNFNNGFGVGFQSLGLSDHFLPNISFEIENKFKRFFNLTDGSFVASKLISEFGLIGLIVTAIYLRHLIKSVFIFHISISKKDKKHIDESNTKYLFVSCFLASFSVEFFIRGYGYFTPSTILFFSSFLYLISRDKFSGKKHYNCK